MRCFPCSIPEGACFVIPAFARRARGDGPKGAPTCPNAAWRAAPRPWPYLRHPCATPAPPHAPPLRHPCTTPCARGGDDDELIVRASAVLRSQGPENWPRGRPGNPRAPGVRHSVRHPVRQGCATPAPPRRHPCATPAPRFAPHAAPPFFLVRTPLCPGGLGSIPRAHTHRKPGKFSDWRGFDKTDQSARAHNRDAHAAPCARPLLPPWLRVRAECPRPKAQRQLLGCSLFGLNPLLLLAATAPAMVQSSHPLLTLAILRRSPSRHRHLLH